MQERLGAIPLQPTGDAERQALELLSWMIARGHLEMKVAIPCDAQRRPIAATVLFHEKAGVVEDKAGHRLAFNGSVNETAQGWSGNWESFHVFTDWVEASDRRRVDVEEASFSEAVERQGATLPRHRHSRRRPRRVSAVSPPGWRDAIAAPRPSGSCS